jgi:hypothetical protein
VLHVAVFGLYCALCRHTLGIGIKLKEDKDKTGKQENKETGKGKQENRKSRKIGESHNSSSSRFSKMEKEGGGYGRF